MSRDPIRPVSRRRRAEREQAREKERRRGQTGWRRVQSTVNSVGGWLTVGLVAFAAVAVVGIIIMNPLSNGGLNTSSDPPLGEPVPGVAARHVSSTAAMQITAGDPPAAGPHFGTPQRFGIYDDPINDGNAVHALEHGLVWISYRADLLSEAELEALEDLAGDFRRDVILSPRPENANAVTVVSWGWIMRFDELDEAALREFIETNVNRSPEPGIR